MSKISPDEVVLGLLAEKSCHGYQLLVHFRDSYLGQIWKLSTSHLYAILKRLEQRGEIDGRETGGENAPIRTEYWLTAKGKKRLTNWLNDAHPSPSTRHVRTTFLSRLYVAQLNHIPLEPIIQAQKSACQKHLQILLNQRQQTASGLGYLSVDLVVTELEALIAWFDRCAVELVITPSTSDINAAS